MPAGWRLKPISNPFHTLSLLERSGLSMQKSSLLDCWMKGVDSRGVSESHNQDKGQDRIPTLGQKSQILSWIYDLVWIQNSSLIQWVFHYCFCIVPCIFYSLTFRKWRKANGCGSHCGLVQLVLNTVYRISGSDRAMVCFSELWDRDESVIDTHTVSRQCTLKMSHTKECG